LFKKIGINFAAILVSAYASVVSAEPLNAPVGEPILKVSGKIENANQGQDAVFDLDMLEDLKGRDAEVRTPWTDGDRRFSGPFLREVLKKVGAKGSKLHIEALNGYEVNVPISDANELDVILATRMDGKVMSVRNFGPTFLLYPFDQKASLYKETYFARSIWQIVSIEVVE
jgi:hypothetical protein